MKALAHWREARIRRLAIRRIAESYPVAEWDVAALYDEIGEFGAEMTVFLALRLNLTVSEAKAELFRRMAELARAARMVGCTAAEAAANFERAARAMAPAERLLGA